MKQSNGCSIISSRSRRGALATLVGAILMSGAAVAAPPTYHIAVLPELPGTVESEAEAISDAGHIVGNSFMPDGSGGAISWGAPPYVPQPLAVLPWHNAAYVDDVNDAGSVVGWGWGAEGPFAVMWDPSGAVVGLGDLPGQQRESNAYAINAFGLVVGVSEASEREIPVSWAAPGATRRLGVPAYGGQAFGVNDLGDIVGYYRDFLYNNHAVLWLAGQRMQELGDLPGGPYNGSASAINNARQVVGSSQSEAHHHRAVLWNKDGSITDLGDINNGDYSYYAIDINEGGTIIGYSTSGQDFLWTAEDGMMDLYDLIDPADPLRELFRDRGYIRQINSSGVIVGEMVLTSPEDPNTHAIMLVPEVCPPTRLCARKGR